MKIKPCHTLIFFSFELLHLKRLFTFHNHFHMECTLHNTHAREKIILYGHEDYIQSFGDKSFVFNGSFKMNKAMNLSNSQIVCHFYILIHVILFG